MPAWPRDGIHVVLNPYRKHAVVGQESAPQGIPSVSEDMVPASSIVSASQYTLDKH